jgi:hypothetical protein
LCTCGGNGDRWRLLLQTAAEKFLGFCDPCAGDRGCDCTRAGCCVAGDPAARLDAPAATGSTSVSMSTGSSASGSGGATIGHEDPRMLVERLYGDHFEEFRVASNSNNCSYNSSDFRGKVRLYRYMARVDEEATMRRSRDILHGIAAEADEREGMLRLEAAAGAMIQELFDAEQHDEEMENTESGDHCSRCGGCPALACCCVCGGDNDETPLV